MNKNNIKEIAYMIISVMLGILAVKFVIWLLPIILFLMVSHYIYNSLKRSRIRRNKNTKPNKTIKIIEMVSEDE